MYNLINWSGVSKLLTGDPRQIRKDYSGKKYKRVIDRIRRVEKALVWFIKSCT